MKQSISCFLRNEIIGQIQKDVPKKEIMHKYNLSEDLFQELYNDALHVNEVIKKIKLLIKKDIYKALELCEQEEYYEYFSVQIQRLKILIKLKRYDDVILLCNKPLYLSCSAIQYQGIIALMNQESDELLKEALKICDKYPNDFQVQTLKISILIKLGELKRAFNFGSEIKFYHYIPIQVKIVDILIQLGDLRGALAFCSQKRFRNCIQMKKKQQEISRILNENKTFNRVSVKEQIQDLNQINELEIEAQRMILTVAFYEKNKYPLSVILNYLNQQKALNGDNKTILKIIKCLISHVKEKNKIMNYEFYEKILRSIK